MIRSIAGAFGALLTLMPLAVQAKPFTDAAGRTVELPDHIGKVLAAGPPASVLVYAIAPEKLAGWVREPKEDEKPYLMEAVRGLPTYGRLTGKGGTANIEAVLAAKPDVIIDVGTVDATYASLADKVQSQTGIPYVLIDGSFGKSAETLRSLGAMLGAEERAGKLADYADETLKELGETIAAVPADERPRVYYGRGPDGLETGLAGSIDLEILEAAGAVNVAAVAGKSSLTQVSPEQLLAWNPEMIIAASPKFASAVATDPAWSRVQAVEKGQVFIAPSMPFGWFDSPPGINRLIGVRWLEALLYGGFYEGDLKAETREFYKLFYQVDLDDAQLTRLVKGALPETQ
ncbi:ABC transporter substrate-binding protein [Ensifer sp. Root31]|uniref:iron ABC transporter substrate-binding protein n=1 Tax=Ensifer sp. Root31 TaxID=1736512 RepID=UPI00070E2DB7|nr:iron ABC transporter substrate-binding protein [Ensifer sp. Root31]KQU81735.1 ABC transporter substrate-binding protein [Ensifer sp. Root31]